MTYNTFYMSLGNGGLHIYHTRFCRLFSSSVEREAGAQLGGYLGHLPPPDIFKTFHSNSDICRNFQRI